MKILVFVQANLGMVEGMVVGESLKKLNPSTINITKVPTLPRRDERIEDFFFNGRKMHKIKIVHEDVKFKDIKLKG
jgi:hypothetical protein